MENRWAKVRTVWPDQRVDLRINANLRKKRGVLKRAEQFPLQDRSKIDGLGRGVLELDPQSERGDLLERSNSMNFMRHMAPSYFNGSILIGGRPFSIIHDFFGAQKGDRLPFSFVVRS
jgi:hypothetical protein